MTSVLESDGARDKEVQAELERLARLRRNVANGLMALSESARRDATALLSLGADGPTNPADRESPDDDARAGFMLWQVASAFLMGLACGLAAMRDVVPGVTNAPRLAETLSPTVAEPRMAPERGAGPDPETEAVTTAAPESVGRPEPDESGAVPSAVVAERLVVNLTASRPCWVRTTVDGGDPVERTLGPGDAIVLEAEQEVSLRVGDAGAVALLIDGQPALPLGDAGQVVNTRITRANVGTFFAG